MADLSVVGLDLATRTSVHVDDQPRHVWKAKGYGGDGTLVCWHCYNGVDAPTGTLVRLLYRGGKKYGKVRAHFAHPKGQAPSGGHHPETLWHANAKQTLVRWARTQPGVADAHTEYRTADGRRRSDVAVTLVDGTKLAIEVQQQPTTDEAWSLRHGDYVAAGIVDVWLWHPRIGTPGIARDEPQCHWLLAAGLDRLGIPIAGEHGFDGAWWERPDHRLRAPHYPPCPGDTITSRWAPLIEFGISPTGLTLPAAVVAELRDNAAKAAVLAETVRRKSPGVQAAGTPLWQGSAPARLSARQYNAPATTAVHEVHRIDALPPDADPDLRRYRCQVCDWVPAHALTGGIHKLVEWP
jgi:hypothetical protein